MTEQSIDTFIGHRAHMVQWGNGMTITDLAARSGVSQSTMSKKLRGSVAWSAADVVRVSAALSVSVVELLPEIDESGQPTGRPLSEVAGAGFEPATSGSRARAASDSTANVAYLPPTARAA